MKFRILWAMVIVILLAFALRVTTLGDKSVWWDEAWSVWVAQQPIDQTTFITASDVHPPLYQWALHVWVRLTGITEFAVRYLSLLWSVLTVALVYTLGSHMGGRRAGLIAAFFVAGSVFAVHWAQETRMYAQASFFTALVSYAYLRLRQMEQTKRLSLWWLVLVLSGTAVALTHYLGAFALVILNIHWLLSLRTQPRTFHLRWLGAMVATGAILMLWVIYAIGLTRSGSVANDFDAALAFQLFATLMTAGTSVNLDQYTLIALIGAGLYFAGLALYVLRKRRNETGVNALLVALMAILPPLAIYALSLPETPFYAPKPEERYMIIFAPLVFAGIGLGLDAFARISRVGWVIAGILGSGLLLIYGIAFVRDLDTRYIRDDYAMLHRVVDTLAQPDEPILFVSDDRYPLVFYHMNRAADDGYSDFRIVGITSPEGNVQDSVMRDLLDGAERFWVVQIERHFRDPDGLTIAWYDKRFERVYHEDIDYNSVTLYATEDLAQAPQSDEILPPVVAEARPFDWVRIGAPDDVTWRSGDTVIRSDDIDTWRLSQLQIYPAYPNGTYEIEVGDTETFTFEVTHSQDASSTPQVTLDTDFGDLTTFGYDIVRGEAKAGESFEIRLHWRVDAVPQQNYTVFAQLLGPFRADGPVWASDDGYPAETPTTALWEGLAFTDTHTLTIPEDMPAGTHQFAFGLYLLETGERLTLPDGSDAIIVDGLRVVE